MGFDIWLTQVKFAPEARGVVAKLRRVDAGKPSRVLVSLNAESTYAVTFNGRPAHFRQLNAGVLEVELPPESQEGTLEVSVAVG